MIIIQSPSVNPYFNLASEEYLLDGNMTDIFMLWRNEKAVIIGRNQNAYAEINSGYTEEHSIKVVRRLTGGGAVFHDLGNINYTFITDDESGGIDFVKFCTPIVNSLRELGLDASLSGRNDILIDGKKVSGTAQTVRNGKRLHHGCILYSADLTEVAGALKVDRAKLESKGIKSVSSRVKNISDFLAEKGVSMSVEQFCDYLIDYVIRHSEKKCDSHSFTDSDIKAIQSLSETKYSQWWWNFGKSHELSDIKKRRFPFGTLEISYTLDGGIIKAVHITGDFFGSGDISLLEHKLEGLKFEVADIYTALETADTESYISGCSTENFISLLFDIK